uniref:Ig-like domain-containing protein n=1 Tax=Neolamprologus brichardi TaxID=32507 RepID=A0A3Q4IGL5_NEOBR
MKLDYGFSLIIFLNPLYCLICIKVGKNYAPKLPSVSVSPSAEIVEGSSVTLTCSSDANPAASYTWYKENEALPLGPEGSHHFTSISSEDRGNYFCKSENQYGQIKSSYVFINVQCKYSSLSKGFSILYAPKLPSVSVTLTCSSDANPAANYTWYKEKEDSQKAHGQTFTIDKFSPAHSGTYQCKVQNNRGHHSLTFLLAGSSVTLTCSSDANPAANYTWYKEDDESPKASGQNFTITDIQPEHSGSYYCVAQNSRGHQNSILQLNVVPGQLSSREFHILIPLTVRHICLCVVLANLCLKSNFLLLSPLPEHNTNTLCNLRGNVLFFALHMNNNVCNFTKSSNFNNFDFINKLFVCSLYLTL